MTQEIQPYDPNSIMRKVTDRIKASFAELIPDEKWQEMVEAQVKAFTEPKVNRYGDTQPESEFSKMCQEVLKEVAKEQIAKHVKAKYEQKFKDGKLIDDALGDLLAENAAVMLANVMRQQAQSLIYTLQNQAGTYR